MSLFIQPYTCVIEMVSNMNCVLMYICILVKMWHSLVSLCSYYILLTETNRGLLRRKINIYDVISFVTSLPPT